MTICEAACWSNAESPTLRDVNKHPASIQNTLHSRNSLIYRASYTSSFTLKMVAYTTINISTPHRVGAAVAPPWVSHPPWKTHPHTHTHFYKNMQSYLTHMVSWGYLVINGTGTYIWFFFFSYPCGMLGTSPERIPPYLHCFLWENYVRFTNFRITTSFNIPYPVR